MRLDPLLVHEPMQHLGRAVGPVSRQPLRLETKALSGTLQHGAGCAHFGLPYGSGGLHVHDHSGREVDKVVVRIGKERGTAHGPGPLGRRVRG